MTTISSGDFEVANQSFPDWFNDHVRGTGDFISRINGDAFKVVFDHTADLWAPELTVPQFVAFFSIFYNETGGSFRPVAEYGGPAYCFGTTMPGGRTKASYNRKPNRLAGDQLLESGVIQQRDVAMWNGTIWPALAPIEQRTAAEQCDFYKFRGHGYIQTTWRPAYLQQVDPLLQAAGLPLCDDMMTAELDAAILNTPSVSLGMVKGFFSQPTMKAAFAQVDALAWASTGTHLSGSSAYGMGVYTMRCRTLYNALVKAGF